MMNDVKILLINPPFHRLFGEKKKWFPLGIYYLREFLNSFEGIQAFAFNADNSDISKGEKLLTYKERHFNSQFFQVNSNHEVWNEIESHIKEIKPDIVCIYSFSEGFSSAIKVSKIARSINNEITIVLGGPHTECMEEVENTNFDFIVKGEGEIKLLKIINNLFPIKGKTIGETLSEKYKTSIDDEIIVNVDLLPYPFNQEDKSFINSTKIKLPLLLTKGGCQMTCSHCMFSISKRKIFRQRSVESIIEEIKNNKHLFGVNRYFIVDDTFTHDLNYVKKFCHYIKNIGFEVSWSCTTHVKFINNDLLTHMKSAGCHSIHIGVETGNEEILKLANKQTTKEEIVEKSILIKNSGLKLKTFFMVGHPSETVSDINESKELIKKLKADESMLHVYIPYPNTRMYRHIQEKYPKFPLINWENFKRIDLESNLYMGNDINSKKKFDEEVLNFFDFIEEYEKK